MTLCLLTVLRFRLLRSEKRNRDDLPKVNRTYWLRAEPDIQRIKQNVRDAREMLRSKLDLLGLSDR
jgi:hypothetical protein